MAPYQKEGHHGYQRSPHARLHLATRTRSPFERTSKRRRGFPSETQVKRGRRVVHGEKELVEKLGRNDPCPCGSGRRFQELLSTQRQI
jgi:SEC-C motif